jgi:mono/diheme cytochrome c family protein
MGRMKAGLLGLLAALLLMGASAATPEAERGKYLAVIGDCVGCHTNHNQPTYSGGRPLSAGFGVVYSSNITPDKPTGIGNWTADQFYRAMHKGISASGKHLYPAFPYPYFTHIARADTNALFAYLKTLKPVRAIPPKDRLVFPFNIRTGMIAWNAMFLDARPFAADQSKSAAWNRGAYIVNGLGHCGACHTPKNVLFGDKINVAFTGETLDHWFSANLTGSKQDGLGTWSKADIVQYLKTGQNTRAIAVGSMQEVVTLSTSKMQDSDLGAIAEYLKSLPAQSTAVPEEPLPKQMAEGQAVFVVHCAVCHLSTETAHGSRAFPLLDGDTLIQGHSSTTVLHVLLEGSQSPKTENAPTGYSMPSFAALSDRNIADVATFIRNAWSNRADAVSVKDVTKLRKELQP